jgi:hypothetical protein
VTRRRLVIGGAVVAVGLVGVAITLSVSSAAQPATAASSMPRPSTATVVRTDLVTTQLTAATLGYGTSPPVVNQLQGIYTALAAPASTVSRGDVLYRVDNEPVILMVGTVPAWRPFTAAMTDGPDVFELEANLIALGDAGGLFTAPSSHFSSLTAAAIERWQSRVGYASDGSIGLGQIVFLPGPVLVGAPSVVVGQGATPQQEPFAVSTTAREVDMPLNPESPPVTVGETVSVVLPTNATTDGTVTAIEPPPPGTSGGQGSSSSDSGNSDQPQVSAIAVVTPNDPSATGTTDGVAVQVSLTTQDARNVLAVPISALLALAEGGYAVEAVQPSGVHRLLAVTTGVFTGTQVQVSGEGIDAGTRVVVAQ